MTNLLQINTSIRTTRSISRLLAKEFVEQWIASNPESTLTYRDIGQFPIPHVTEEWMDVAASSSPAEPTLDQISELFFSNELVDELLVNDLYLIATPILNFTIPSTLVTYIDLIVRNGLTVEGTNHDPQGLLHNKKLIVIATQRNNYPYDNQDEVVKHFESYLRHIFEHIGVTNISFIYACNQSAINIERIFALSNARKAIKKFIADW
jgi:FMN-dependent NADH-azoreductase